jgi:hydrogenase maturation protein HypF
VRPLALAGGERAIHQPWRLALAALDDAFDGAPPLEALGLFRRVSPEDVAAVRRLLARGVASPRAHGVGRWFDAFGALGLAEPESRFEGEVAAAWGNAVDPRASGAYALPVDRAAALPAIDPRPAVRAAVADLVAGVAPGAVAARFHRGLVRAAAATVREAADAHGRLPVVLTGGCFQNPWLVDGVCRALAGRLPVYRHREVPPGDGGLALGQVLAADARTRPCA